MSGWLERRLNSQLQIQDRSTRGFSFALDAIDGALTAQLGSSLIMEVNELWAAIPSADTRNTNNAPDIPFIFHLHVGENEL